MMIGVLAGFWSIKSGRDWIELWSEESTEENQSSKTYFGSFGKFHFMVNTKMIL